MCDQMRYAAALLQTRGQQPLFLMNVPSTWQTETARRLYREEVRRLGRFLVQLGGREPSREELALAMRESEASRPAEESLPQDAIPLALLGGPMTQRDAPLVELIERSGARIVLDASETGERCRPLPFNRERLTADPLEALAEAYFHIPDPFRRPNGPFYEWLGGRLAARGVRGILLRRYVWCDLWHAELYRLREWSPVPVLDLDAAQDDAAARARTTSRVEAFLEMLR
jgi:benzoyl-CoA reductase/2-hydroxyglutaryl-CoA dehydratase subunit BcrC/BadD/HgdB